jgi:hypothetical protein
LYAPVYHTANTEGDDFIFAYSTDNSNYTDMVTITRTSDDNTCQSYVLSSNTSGTVYIRVRDANRTAGRRVLDTIYVDHLYIRSEAAWSKADFNSDGLVNFYDYAKLAAAWMSSLGEPDFNDIYDLSTNDVVDMADIGIFTDYWLCGSGP